MEVLSVITPPAAEPVTATEAKAQCRVTTTDHDTTFTRLIAAARNRGESITGRAFINQTLELQLDAWPYQPNVPTINQHAIFLPRPPVSSITSVKYDDADGVEQTLVDGTDYEKQIADPFTRIVPATNTTWPTTSGLPGCIRVRYVAGYGAASTNVPEDLRSAMLMLIDHFFRNTSDEITGTITSHFNTASESIFRSYAVRMVA